MSSITLTDKYSDEVTIHDRYILYRNRSIDSACVDEIRVKGFRLTINSYKQNTSSPTMCIHFPTKEDAEYARNAMLDTWYSTYPSDEKPSSYNVAPVQDTLAHVFLVLVVAFVVRGFLF